MPSSEKIISPGVFTNEIDKSHLPAAIGEIGAALIGPTVRGPAGIPTVVNSYSEYQSAFGDTFRSGSGYYQYFTSHAAREYLRHGSNLTVVRIMAGSPTKASSFIPTGSYDGNFYTGSTTLDANAHNFKDGASSFKLHVLNDGSIMNSGVLAGGFEGTGSDLIGSNNALKSGSAHNLRWEISNQRPKKGTFSLLIRRGDDTNKRKQVIENWNNMSLDPNASNYIAKIIGNQVWSLNGQGTSDPYLSLTGDYPNKSKYVRVEVLKKTANYLDENGDIRVAAATGSLPGVNSGSFAGGGDGYFGFDGIGNFNGSSTKAPAGLFYENIESENIQGYNPTVGNAGGGTAYEDAINLLGNQDEYDINLVLMPGVSDSAAGTGAGLITKAIDMCEDRGDCFVIADPGLYSQALPTAAAKAEARDSSYGAMYYPWIQIGDPDLGKNVWVPPSTIMGGIYAFNDKVAHPWFAPAGLNRGGLDMAIQAERKLTHSNRDTLYESNVNPIATFPGQGVTVWGQKTLQKKSSALDRINVRRLLIKVKKFLASTSRFLVFEQNTSATRKRFLSIANPYLEQVQSNAGLNAFRVVMDESNNTPDLVDRNILYGQIFLQPTRTAEFIVLDFTVQPTGATFPE